VTYVDRNFVESTRTVRISAVVMERHETFIDAVDVANGEHCHLRLDRIARAELPRFPATDG